MNIHKRASVPPQNIMHVATLYIFLALMYDVYMSVQYLNINMGYIVLYFLS